jgi:hypothetical protein
MFLKIIRPSNNFVLYYRYNNIYLFWRFSPFFQGEKSLYDYFFNTKFDSTFPFFSPIFRRKYLEFITLNPGPDLPKRISYFSVVVDTDGGALVVGGQSDTILDTIYK